MEENRIERTLYIDGYEVTATFLPEPDPEVIRHVKRIIMTSYIDQTLSHTAIDKVDDRGTARYCRENT